MCCEDGKIRLGWTVTSCAPWATYLISQGVELCWGVSNIFFFSSLFLLKQQSFTFAISSIISLSTNICCVIQPIFMEYQLRAGHSLKGWCMMHGRKQSRDDALETRGAGSVFLGQPCTCQQARPFSSEPSLPGASLRNRDLCIFPVTCGFTGGGDT